MGDGGVACVPSQHVMERFPNSDTYCRGNGGFNSKSHPFSESQLQRKHEKKMEVVKEEFGSERGRNGEFDSLRGKKVDFEKGEITSEKSQKDEIEEGELDWEKEQKREFENGEFVPERVRKKEVDKGEFIPAKWRRGGEVEKGEFIPDKFRRGEVEKRNLGMGRGRRDEVEKGEFARDKWRRGEVDKTDFDLGRGRKGELEKGEFIPHKWRKGEVVNKDEFSSARGRKWEVDNEFVKEKGGWKCDKERTPPSMKFSEEDSSQRKEFSRSESEWRKRPNRWDPNHDRDSKISSRLADDELGSFKHSESDGKIHGKDYSSGSWLKRHGTDSDSNSRRYHGDFGDHPSLKSRRISDDNNRYFDKRYSGNSMERSYRNSSSASSRVSSSIRNSSRHNESSLAFRGTHDRRGRSPDYFERGKHDRARHYDHRDQSPAYSDRSPHDRARHHDNRSRSPPRLERSPYDRSRHHDRRSRSPARMERSPQIRGRHLDHRDRTPGYMDKSPLDRGRPYDHRESSRKSGGNERQHVRNGIQTHEEKLDWRDSTGRESSHRHSSIMQPKDSVDAGSCSVQINTKDLSQKEEEPHDLSVDCAEPPGQVDEAPEGLMSMEEDMDICDTPPHVTVITDSTTGSWFYLDHFGVEQGPSKLTDLKRLVEEGALQSDHLIKHSESNWWVTVEKAASPLVPTNFQSIVSDTITQLVSPPEAPGNLLADAGDADQPVTKLGQESSIALLQPPLHVDETSAALEPSEDLHIDERVAALLTGYSVIPGKELETLGDVLQMTFEHMDWEKLGSSEGFRISQPSTEEPYGHRRDEEINKLSVITSKEAAETRSSALSNKDYAIASEDSSDWFSWRWSCKGGDWKRNDEAAQERSFKKKLVLNDGYPLCQMPKSGYDDPRWQREDELYCPSRSRRLDLPAWAFSLSEDRNDSSGSSKTSQMKQPLVPRGVKGIVLPVVRINACVVKNHVSSVFEPRVTARGHERHSRSVRSSSAMSNGRSFEEGSSRSRRVNEQDLQKCIAPISIPKDHVCTADELQLHLGDWYYLDGAGHEHGPSSFTELQGLVDKGTIQKQTSVYRKFDQIWVPVTSAAPAAEAATQERKVSPAPDSSAAFSQSDGDMHDGSNMVPSSFHSLHPQFIGYTRGKLHELVMKSYKSREFASAINEVLDPWINAKQPKKDLEKHPFTSSISKSSLLSHDLFMQKFQKSEDDPIHAGKKARLLVDDSEEDLDTEDLLAAQKDDCSFNDLYGDATFGQENGMSSEAEMESWGLLSGRILMQIFHFLRADMKSLAFSAATCKRWNEAVKFYKGISRQVDLSPAGPNCTDSMFRETMNSYNKANITSIILVGCTRISADTLEEILHLFPSISSVDIRGCNQFSELTNKFQNLKWRKSRGLRDTKGFEGSRSKIRSLKQITEKSPSLSKAPKGSSSHLVESIEPAEPFHHDSALDRRDAQSQSFRQSFYRRKKLLDARKSSALLSREARMRRLLCRKSENGYKKMEEFLAFSLKDIMKENTFDFFVPKVAEIEDRMKNGYYIGHGLSSVKEDISRMCRDAIKAKNRGDAGDMNNIIMLFIRLVTSLEENSKSTQERYEMMKMLKDNSAMGFCSTSSKYKKKHNKMMNERKCMTRSNGTAYANDCADNEEYASDREIKRRLSKFNKRTLDSGSDTSDDPDRSSEDVRSDGESTNSDTETDLDIHSEGGIRDLRGNGYFSADEALDSISEDREWGARMTKASLVPPVTRKYEVIDRYVIVADEEEVQRKMLVSLPEEYSEKLNAQKDGIDESDMEIPEVKDYKPRKQLGEEVLEQEVYGIDPYTHNLLLDSMPEELDWSLQEKHLFIEDVLLSTLNLQVRRFTGVGNAPMVYQLKPVVEEIEKTAEERGDARSMRMCQGILKAMHSRPDDNYVAYRKGLGVVCNKEGGFGEDDFVVEFLGEVYPAWKWFEKQDGIRSLQKNNKDPAPEFYNIYLERPRGDRYGYDLVVVDAMHKANYASRICHSCRPNCEAKVTAVDGQYQIGVYTVRPIGYGEEITFDYNSVTESKEEYEASVCLCGSQVCRGSYLNLTGEGAFQKVLEECHGMLDRHQLMLEACELNFVSEEDYIDLGRAGLGTCLLGGLPDWLIAYSARLVRFINFERMKLPKQILRHNLEEKRKFFAEICLEVEKSDAEVQAEGVYNQRLQNLALTLDKVRYVMRCVFVDAKKAPPPLEKLTSEEIVSALWKGEGSLVEELLQCMAPHVEEDLLNDLKSKIHAHDPSGSDDLQRELQKSLLWLRDEVRNLPCTYKCRHDAAADLIHIYAYTRCFFRIREYKSVTSPPVYISPLDLGPKYSDKLGSGFKEYCKTYGENYCLGQLLYWHSQNDAEPDSNLPRARRGCLSLPNIASFYAKAQKPSKQRIYGPRTIRSMLSRMEKQPQRPWPKKMIWSFDSNPRVFASPMLDAIMNKTSLDKEMVHWLKTRPSIFSAMWDR
ncbi:SET domain [Macleaya cordata]|uniref:SET domain n=1 Tax=Macleaya cordata TaxID=56857 RepID=A0A200QMJ1_MACCD|nr:SET domain [Macleaya cordata]